MGLINFSCFDMNIVNSQHVLLQYTINAIQNVKYLAK
jgi:hypothetical protein